LWCGCLAAVRFAILAFDISASVWKGFLSDRSYARSYDTHDEWYGIIWGIFHARRSRNSGNGVPRDGGIFDFEAVFFGDEL
jgi:hypothetical protein